MAGKSLFVLKNQNIQGLKPQRVEIFSDIHSLANWLSPERILKFSGCRDGKGYRYVHSIEEYERWIGYGKGSEPSYRIIGQKVGTYVDYGLRGSKVKRVDVHLRLDPYMTTNDINKIQAYFDPINLIFVKIKVKVK